MATRIEHADQPLDSLLAILPSMPRPVLARLTARLIEQMDLIDGDPDEQQSDGDELDYNGSEDDFIEHGQGWLQAAGCPIADPGGGNVEDEGERAESEDPGGVADYGDDQRELRWQHGSYRIQ